MTSTVRTPVRLARSSPNDLNLLFQALGKTPDDANLRHATADELDRVGRDQEAHFLRNYPEHAMVLNGKVTPYTSHWYSGMHMDGENYDNYANILDEHGAEAVNRELSGYQDLNDFRHQQHSDTPGWGTSDRTYGPFPTTWTNRRTGEEQKGAFHVYHNPGLGYIGTEYEHYQPITLPDPMHTEPLEDAGRGSYTEMKDFADAEVGVPHSFVPFGSDWTIHTAPEHANDTKQLPGLDDDNFDDRYNYSRIRYAQERQRNTPEQDEALFLDAIAKDPENMVLHHAYADHLADQGRHGEAAFIRAPSLDDDPPITLRDGTVRKSFRPSLFDWTHHAPLFKNREIPHYGVMFAYPESNRASLHVGNQFSDTHKAYFQKDMTMDDAKRVLTELSKQPGMELRADTEYQQDNHDKVMNHQETPVRHSAYRAPKGGAVVRGTWYVGGRLIPDLEGDFTNPPVPEQPVVQYPQPKRSLRDRLKAKMGRKEPMVVSYARKPVSPIAGSTAEALINSIREANGDATPENVYADYLDDNGRPDEAHIMRLGGYSIAPDGTVSYPINHGLNTPYHELDNRLLARRNANVRIGNNREIRRDPMGSGDIHVLLHGNHVVTAHPNGDYSLFTQNYHTPTTFSVHQEITGERPNRVRGVTMFRGKPFQEGVRFSPRKQIFPKSP